MICFAVPAALVLIGVLIAVSGLFRRRVARAGGGLLFGSFLVVVGSAIGLVGLNLQT